MFKPQLGFGIMRFKSQDGVIDYNEVRMAIDEYMKGRFCYFDIHPAYVGGKAQEILKDYVVSKYPRDKYFVANKVPYYGIHCYEDYKKTLDTSLSACGLQWFDFYMLHAVTKDVYTMHEKYGGFSFLKQQKKEGTVKNIGISFHDSADVLEEILMEHPEIDFVYLQINYLDWDDLIIQSKKCYQVAVKYKKMIMVMEPVKGGSLANEIEMNDGKKITTKELVRLSIEFVAKLKNIYVILSGMTNAVQVKENRRTIQKISDNSFVNNNEEIYEKLVNIIKASNNIPCTACGYCKRECPKHIEIPEIISLLNTYNVAAKGNISILGGSISTYRGVVYKKGKAGDCTGCGRCEKRCPQKLEIRKYMKGAREMFENDNKYYTTERNAQILIYLMKAHGVKKIVISPGATNICFVQSVQHDKFFEIYSSADERSAAYMACGLAKESGEPVVLSCTGATASRNYIPALTEAYYMKLPIIAITSSQPAGRIGHNIPQMIDRTNLQKDIAKLSVELPLIRHQEDEWICTVGANKALLAATDEDCGPVHINLITGFGRDFSVKQLPLARIIRKHKEIDFNNKCISGRIAIFCGAHSRWSKALTEAVDVFCHKYDAIVIQDHTGNYHGRYGIRSSIIFTQENKNVLNAFDLIIHIGNVSGAYYPLSPLEVWRVNPDGKICDTFRCLTNVFEMSEEKFFREIAEEGHLVKNDLEAENPICLWNDEEKRLRAKIRELPFSNLWIAGKTVDKLPENSEIHLGILNSLRAWNMFELPQTVEAYSNTGGFGIDGCVSSLIGASLANPDRLYFGVVGDLAFFYDMNSLGNRHIGNNVRLMVVNNGLGTEFMNYNHVAAALGEGRRANIAAEGHYGNKSKTLLKSYSESLGFIYLSASNKEEYLKVIENFTNPNIGEASIILEVFTDSVDESDALRIMKTLDGANEPKKIVEVKRPGRLADLKQISNIVLWGTGVCFRKNISRVQQIVNVKYVCDNNKDNWGKHINNGIKCISPEECKALESPFVVIMIENAEVGFQIANQLLDMGISNFDLYANWIKYAKDFKELDI